MAFIDYYERLQISPNAQQETVHRVFRFLAARYHPDNTATGSHEKFLLLKQAYDVLKDPDRRSEYNEAYRLHYQKPLDVFNTKDFGDGMQGESNRRIGVLCLLYTKRRNDPEHAGVSILTLESLMATAREHLQFTLWYLRQKGYAFLNDNTEYEITGAGADYIEAEFPKQHLMQKLLEAAAGRANGKARMDPAGDILSRLKRD